MSFEEEFDKHIRDKADELRYQFDEANWIRASRMLDAQRTARRRKRAAFIIPAALIGVLGAGCLALSSLFSEDVVGTPVTSLVSKTPSVSQKVSLPPADNNEISKHSHVSNHVAAGAAGDIKSTSISSSSGAHRLHSPRTPANIQPSAQQASNDAFDDPAFNQNAFSGRGTSDQGAEPAIVATAQDEPSAFFFLKPVNALLPVAANPVSLRTTPEDYVKPARRRHYTYAEAGALYLEGWTSFGQNDAKGLNAMAAAGYGRYLTQKLSIDVGVQVYQLGHISQPFFAAQSKSYGFNSVTSETVVSVNTMNFVGVPLRFNVKISPRGSVSAGVSAAWFIGSSNTVSSYGVEDGVRTLKHTSTNNARYPGIRNNVMVSAGYSHALCRRTTLNADVMYGLTDLYKNNSYKHDMERPAGVRLSVQYRLFDK